MDHWDDCYLSVGRSDWVTVCRASSSLARIVLPPRTRPDVPSRPRPARYRPIDWPRWPSTCCSSSSSSIRTSRQFFWSTRYPVSPPLSQQPARLRNVYHRQYFHGLLSQCIRQSPPVSLRRLLRHSSSFPRPRRPPCRPRWGRLALLDRLRFPENISEWDALRAFAVKSVNRIAVAVSTCRPARHCQISASIGRSTLHHMSYSVLVALCLYVCKIKENGKALVKEPQE